MTSVNNYTTRQAASIGLQPGNLIGETHYVTEHQITPPVKQRIRTTKLLSTNISRCQCCCPPVASSLCRSCLCPCWAYLLIGLLLTLLVAALAAEVGLLAREKTIYRRRDCQNTVYTNITIDEYNTTTVTSNVGPVSCGPYIPTSGSETTFSYITFLIINIFVYLIKF